LNYEVISLKKEKRNKKETKRYYNNLETTITIDKSRIKNKNKNKNYLNKISYIV